VYNPANAAILNKNHSFNHASYSVDAAFLLVVDAVFHWEMRPAVCTKEQLRTDTVYSYSLMSSRFLFRIAYK